MYKPDERLHKRQLQNKVRLIRLLYYLPMEMWNLMNASLKALLNEQYKLVSELREENKKLKEWNNELIENHKKDIDVLCEENKKLKDENADLLWERDGKQMRIDELEEEIKSRQEEVERFKTNAMQDMSEITELEEENRKLKSDLEECECSFWFENDEVWFWKREYKRLKKWIKDHCKWYWNLFPEDEMKRQWKKADKKRK